jgi:hypothetical protein
MRLAYTSVAAKKGATLNIFDYFFHDLTCCAGLCILSVMSTYTFTSSPDSTFVDSVSVSDSDSSPAFCDSVYAAIKSVPGKELRASDIVAILNDGSTVLKVRSALLGIGRGLDRFPHLHRPARGVYVYDESRPVVEWVSLPKQAKSVKRAKRQVPVKPVADAPVAAPKVGSLGSLRPSASVLMEDSEGNFYLVTPLQLPR